MNGFTTAVVAVVEKRSTYNETTEPNATDEQNTRAQKSRRGERSASQGQDRGPRRSRLVGGRPPTVDEIVIYNTGWA